MMKRSVWFSYLVLLLLGNVAGDYRGENSTEVTSESKDRASLQTYEKEDNDASIKVLERLNGFVKSKDIIDSSFFNEIKDQRIVPYDFVIWNLSSKEAYNETVMLIFLKMFHPDIKPYLNDVLFQTEDNPYMALMVSRFFQFSHADPREMLLLSDIVNWIIENHRSSTNENINNEMQRIRSEFNLTS